MSHGAGEVLTLVEYRTNDAGVAGPSSLSLEVDRRSGAVVCLADVHGAAAGSAAQPGSVVTRDAAVQIALARTRHATPIVSAVSQEVWNRLTWTVELSGTSEDDRFPARERVTVDAATGEVVAVSST